MECFLLLFHTINILTYKYLYRVYGGGRIFYRAKVSPPECVLLEVWKNGVCDGFVWDDGVCFMGRVLVGL